MSKTNIKARVGDTIRITGIKTETTMFPGGVDHQAEKMIGKTGTVTFIDSTGALFGTWGGLSVLPEDEYVIVK